MNFYSDLLIIRYKTCLSIHTSYSVLMLNENKKIAMMPLCWPFRISKHLLFNLQKLIIYKLNFWIYFTVSVKKVKRLRIVYLTDCYLHICMYFKILLNIFSKCIFRHTRWPDILIYSSLMYQASSYFDDFNNNDTAQLSYNLVPFLALS